MNLIINGVKVEVAPIIEDADLDNVDIDGGTIDDVTIGGSTPGPVSGTTGTFSGSVSAESISAKEIEAVPASTSDIPISAKSLQSTAPLGDELVTNYDFSSSTGWTFGTGWSYDSGNDEADHTPGNTAALTQDISVVDGATYQVSFTITNRTAGSVEIDIGGVYIYTHTVNKTFTLSSKKSLVASGSGTQTLSITPSSDFDGSISSISVKAITGTSQAVIVCLDDSDATAIEVRGDDELGSIFLGQNSGETNTTGTDNSFFGKYSGRNNTTGIGNSFFGYSSGQSNTTGGYNSFFGKDSGQNNTIGTYNSFFGRASGYNNTTGSRNSFFGRDSGYDVTEGTNNTFFGYNAGKGITTGSHNTIIGVNVINLDSDLSNTIIIADGDGNKRIYVDSSGNVGLNGVTSPSAKLHVPGDIYCTGKLTSDGGNDPPYILYNHETRQSVIDRIKREIPPGKLNGAVMFFNGEADRMELFVPVKGEFRTLTGELLDTVDPVTETFEVETRYYFDQDVGEVRSYEAPKKQQYTLKPDHEVDPVSGKILRKIKQVVVENDEEVEVVVGEEEVTLEEAIESCSPIKLVKD